MKKRDIFLAVVLIVCLAFAMYAVLNEVPNQMLDEYGQPSSELIISEICTKNDSVLADNDGNHRDYIELYNPGQARDLSGITLTNGKIRCKPFENIVLDAGAYRAFFLSEITTGFALGASGGDCIQLLDPEENIIFQATTAALLSDQVMLYNGSGYSLSYDASPGFPNSDLGLKAFREGTPAQDSPLVISEVLIGNEASLPDEMGLFSDVIELQNRSSLPVQLGNYFLSDSLLQRFRYRLPDLALEPGAYVLIFCDSGNYISDSGLIHANFGLSHGETLVLTDSAGCYSTAAATHEGDGVSLLLQTDGSYLPGQVSLGYANDAEGVALFRRDRVRQDSPLVISEVLLSSAGIPYQGSFSDAVEIRNRSDTSVSTKGWYLFDGTDPYAFPLPEQVLKAGECLVIPCTPQTTGFSLAVGETLYLMTPDYRWAQPVDCLLPETCKSISLVGDNTYTFQDVTLGYENLPQNNARYLADQLTDGLQISELMSANQSYLPGAYATTSDWIELYNASSQDILLSEYCLTDSKGNLTKYALPEQTLGAGQYCVIFLKDDPLNLRKGYPVIGMSLSSQGETLYLSKNGSITDFVVLPHLATDVSYGRSGGVLFSTLASVTPGKANAAAAPMASMPSPSLAQGSYDGVDSLDIALSGEGAIYYTTDCTVPTRYSKQYTGPIHLTKTTVIRAICIPQQGRASEILDLTYLINENDNLPAVSLVTEPKNLWDMTQGIYVTGYHASPEMPHYGANYWMDWEKRATISLFETDGGGFSLNCGIKIFGGFTRTLEKKSLSCFFRDTYGASELCYPLFGEDSLDTYESIILRTSGQDAFSARMRDVVITSLVGEHTDVPVQQYKPVVVYLNGRYFGLHYIREKINENFIAGHYNMAAEDVHLTVLGGWNDPVYQALLNFTASHDMSIQENYDYVCSQIDVENYIDFFVAQIWIGNNDNGNVKYFISPEGKWTWIVYDTDISFYDPSDNTLKRNLSRFRIGTADITCKTFAVQMMRNPQFKELFLQRLAWQMNNIWTEENVIGRINEIEGMIIGDMEKECKRWQRTYSSWESAVDHLRSFAEKRNGYMLKHIQNYFSLTDDQMRQYGFNI